MVSCYQNTKYKIQNTRIRAEAGASLAQIVKGATRAGLTGLEWAVGIPGTVGGAAAVNASAFGSRMDDIVEKTEKIDKIIWSVVLKLKKENKSKIKNKIKEFLDYRRKTQPLGSACAGCIFSNPAGQSAGRLIDLAGLKGASAGGAKISEKHANFILNIKNAQAKDVLTLIKLAKKTVKEKFNVNLELEINLLGFDSFNISA